MRNITIFFLIKLARLGRIVYMLSIFLHANNEETYIYIITKKK